jgi:hypothetical protein
VDHGFIHSIYAFDPNNIPIEFSYSIRGVEIRKNPAMRDKKPSDVTLEGAEPQTNIWPSVDHLTPSDERKVYPGAGSELFHGLKNEE